jgi:hypothetical protein
MSSLDPQDDHCGQGISLGVPERIDVQRIVCQPGLCLSQSSLTSSEVGFPVVSLATAAHSDGIWVVWKSAPLDQPGIEWALFHESTGEVLRGELSHAGDWPLEYAVDALGDSLVVVWGNDPADNPADLNVTMLNDQGEVTATAWIEPPFSGPLGAVGSPNADSVTVAWSDTATQRIRVARFDCL